MHKLSDEEIVKLLETDIERAFNALMSVYQAPIYWHIRRLVVTHDDAQDIAQNTFIRVFRFFRDFRGKSTIRSWIYSIATREALNYLTRQKAPPSVPIEGNESVVNAVESAPYFDNSDALVVKLQRAIHTLPPKQQMVFNMRYYDELPYNEIAAVVGSTVSSAKANYHHAKERIMEYMNNND